MRDDHDIVLVDEKGWKQRPAPAGFDWTKYPGVIVIDGTPWTYSGCVEGTPYYVHKGD